MRNINVIYGLPKNKIVTCRTPNAAVENYIAGFFTEHYVLINGVYPYLRRLEDIIAVVFSDSTDIWCLAALSTQDTETIAVNLVTDTNRKQEKPFPKAYSLKEWLFIFHCKSKPEKSMEKSL